MGSRPAVSETSRRRITKPQRSPFEPRILRFSVLLVAPGLILSGALIWWPPWTIQTKLAILGAQGLLCLLTGILLHDHITRPLQALANVVEALRDEDFSFRARMTVPNDALGELSLEINALADLLSKHRTGVMEATALLQRVIEAVSIPIFAFDSNDRVRLMNLAGERLLPQPSSGHLGRAASDLGLKTCLTCANEELVSLPFSTGVRWLVRRSSFRQDGVPHTLVVLSDVSRALRQEEREAWQRLIRVIGHELNNSLTPIKSIAKSLSTRLVKMDTEKAQRQAFERGLQIIESRAASLNRFLQAYRRLAQIPPPRLQECSISALVKQVAALETRVPVTVVPGPDLILMADPDQLEQMLINLMRNAAEAQLEGAVPGEDSGGAEARGKGSDPQIIVSWRQMENDLILTVEDNGPGLINPANAFVPFYTTKPEGTGIGLVLSRQIAEAHNGSLQLSGRRGQQGCLASIKLPVEKRAKPLASENSLLSVVTKARAGS